MSEPGHHPISYLSPGRPSFWTWESDGIVFDSGPTLTFRDELTQLIRHLQPYGLPPMASLLLFMAATRTQWSLPAGLKAAWKTSLRTYDPILLLHHLPEDWDVSVEAFLMAIHRVDSKWRGELDGKCVLAEICFENCENKLDPDGSQAVVDLLECGFIPPSEPLREDPAEGARRLASGLYPLLGTPPDLSPKRLEVRMRTGLDALITSSHREQPLSLQVRTLLTNLQDDPELQGLAKLTRNLMATVHIPRALADPEDLPLGGFSDIANRGSLDRLLTSELAQDDLVLSVRLALNEALFLRREAPPKSPQNARLLLVDNGIRLWGIPRLFAVAVGLAIESMTERGTRVEAYVPTRNQQLREVRLHTHSGLLEALSHLHPHAHPGNALLELTHRLDQHDHRGDLILITQADVLNDPSFQSILALIPRTLYVAAVQRGGRFALYQCRQERRKLLREASLDLGILTSSPEEAGRLKDSSVPEELPSIFHYEPFPLRLPCAYQATRSIETVDEGRLCVVGDGRVLHFPDVDKGGVQLCDHLPKGHVVPVTEKTIIGASQHIVAVYQSSGLTLFRISCVSGVSDRVTMLCRCKPLHILIIHQTVVVIFSRRITLHALGTGEQLAELVPNSKIRDCDGDLVHMDASWHRVSVDGMRPRLDAVGEIPRTSARSWAPMKITLRKQFRGIHIEGSGKLVLFPRKAGPPVSITYRDDSQELRLRPWSLPTTQPVLFKDVTGPKGARYRLRQAAWDNGSRAILDDRGLLHLIGAGGVPEITLTLTHDGPLSGWSSLNERMGDPYFFSSSPTTPASVFAEHVAAFCLSTKTITLPASLA